MQSSRPQANGNPPFQRSRRDSYLANTQRAERALSEKPTSRETASFRRVKPARRSLRSTTVARPTNYDRLMSLRLVALLSAMLVIPMLVLVGIGAWEIRDDFEPAYSCTDAGIEKTLEVAQEVGSTVSPGYVASAADNAHGCDSTQHGVYEFELGAKPEIVQNFKCRPVKEPKLYEVEMRCQERRLRCIHLGRRRPLRNRGTAVLE
jgi:hypothetical protein